MTPPVLTGPLRLFRCWLIVFAAAAIGGGNANAQPPPRDRPVGAKTGSEAQRKPKEKVRADKSAKPKASDPKSDSSEPPRPRMGLCDGS